MAETKTPAKTSQAQKTSPPRPEVDEEGEEEEEETQVPERPSHAGKDYIPVEILHGTYHERTPHGIIPHGTGSVVWVSPAMRDSNPDQMGAVGSLKAVAASAQLNPRAVAALQKADRLEEENATLREELNRLKAATK